MSKQPEAYIDFEVYEDSVNLVGVAKVTPPDIEYLTAEITGAGIAGTVEAVLIGMVNKMTTTLNFRSVTDAATKLMTPEKHQLDLRVAEQYWDSVNAKKEVWADKYVVLVIPKKTSVGEIAPATAANVSGEYTTYYYAGYKDGEKLWEIDPFNQICTINGVDYMASVRKALGKS